VPGTLKVLVTGGSGTIGSYVLRELLAAGHDVTSFGRTASVVDGASFAAGDVTSGESLGAALPGHDVVVHLAAVSGPWRASRDTLMHLNVTGTLVVLDAAVAAGVRTVVFASSGAATGFSFQSRPLAPAYLPLDEDHPCDPDDPYGLSKLLGEEACARWTQAFGIRTICLRINNTWYVDRPGAELAVRSGWARGMTVEELWSRYRPQVVEPDVDWPIPPGPPHPRDILFAVTDGRDMAQAVRLAVEDETLEHEVLATNGSDTSSLLPSAELAEKHFADVPLVADLPGHATLVSHDRATRLLGYTPRHTWRESDFGEWLFAGLAGREGGSSAACS
jgi:nucleoside-diphosphate-sugar epimerase